MKRRDYKQGAAVESSFDRYLRHRAEVSKQRAAIAAQPVTSEAHALALANKRKSWAKRWLRAHREYLRANGLIEISVN